MPKLNEVDGDTVTLTAEYPEISMQRITLFSLLWMLILPASLKCVAQNDRLEKAHVIDPTASFLDVVGRRNEFKAVTNRRLRDALSDTRGCINSKRPSPPAGPMIIPPHYLTGSAGPVNPREAIAAERYYELEDAVDFGATRYLATGEHAEAACVTNLMTRWASAKALLDYTTKESSQSWFQVEWVLSSISLGYSVVQSDASIAPDQKNAVLAWMHDVAEYMLAQDHATDLTKENNHGYWRALAATSVGILTNDDTLYRRGLEQYLFAMGQMNSDGSLPMEMARHENALHYQNFALAPLAMIAELATRQGVDLYSLRVNGHTFMDGVNFLIKASTFPDVMKQYATEKQTFSLYSGDQQLAWLEFWVKRHPAPFWNTVLTKPLFDARIGGNATLYAAPTH